MADGMPPAPPSSSLTIPELTDGVVRLRAHRFGDVPRIVEQCLDPESIRWTTVPLGYDEAMGRDWVETIHQDWGVDGANRLWAIEAVADDDTEHAHEFLGTIDVRPRGGGLGAIGFGLHPEGRGRHLMTGALRLATQWWFDQGGVRMFWDANAGNFASWRVAWACGFTFQGVIPQGLDHRGTVVDAWRASVGRDDDLTRPVKPWREQVVLEGEGVRLRPWRDDDVDALEPGDSPSHFMPPGAEPIAETYDAWRLRRGLNRALGKATNWCIADSATDRALGDVCLIEDGQEEGTVELGYFLLSSARGRGAATAAGRLGLTYAFTPVEDGGLGMRRAVALTVGDNDASSAVLQRLGFAEWGREPAFCAREDGSFDDARHWVLRANPTSA